MRNPKEQETVSLEIGDYTIYVSVVFTRVDDEKMWHEYELVGIERPEQVDLADTGLTEDDIQREITDHYAFVTENSIEPPLEALAFVIQASEDRPAGVTLSKSGLENMKRVKDWFVQAGGTLLPPIRR